MSLDARLRPRPLSPHLAIYRLTSTMMIRLRTANLMARATLIGSVILTMLIWNVGNLDERAALIKETRSPLSHIRGPGSAKAGTRDFLIRRLTDAANASLALLLIASIIALTGVNHSTVRSYLGNPLVAIPTLQLVLCGT
jgi:hypothetical protein